MTIWIGTYQVTTETARAFSSTSSRVRRAILLIAPTAGTFPLIASGIGQRSAVPGVLAALPEIPGGPWDDFGKGLTQTLGSGLMWTASLTWLAAAAFFVLSYLVGERLQALCREINDHYFRSPRLLLATIGLFAATVVLIVWSPLAVPRVLGEFGVLCLFTICVSLLLLHLSVLTMRWHFPFIPLIAVFCLVLGLLNLNDDHVVRSAEPDRATADTRAPGRTCI